MTRLPSSLQPVWPLVKRLHRWASLLSGFVARGTSRFHGDRGLPRRSSPTSLETAAREPQHVTRHEAGAPDHIRRELAPGHPAAHWIFQEAQTFDVPARYSLEIAGGVVVGDYGAILTPDHTLDYETSEYFGIAGWREHPLFLRQRLPPVEDVDGLVVVMGTRGGSTNYYHFLLDVLPRYGVFEDTMPGTVADALYVPADAAYQRDLLSLVGLGDHAVVETRKHRAVRAERLVVPCLPNPHEVAPRATVEWLRERLPAVDTADKPRRIYVTRGTTRNTRRLVREPEVWPLLEERGFVRVEPGGMSVRDQIDTFAAAEVIVAPHGAALTNLVFASPGVRVLELFPAEFVKACFWAITESIPGARYAYLVDGEPADHGRHQPMNRIQADIELSPEAVIAAVDALLAD